MKIIRNTIGLLSGVAVLVAMGASASAAGAATLLVDPTGGSYTTGGTFTVTISEDSGTNDVDSARAQLSYDAGTLEIVGYSTAGNPFTTCVSPASYGGGSINTGDCTLLGGKKQGRQPLGAVTFKVLANSGSSSLVFSSSSQVVSNGVDSALSFINGSYSYSAPAQGGQGGGGGGDVSNSGGSSSSHSSSSNNGSSSSWNNSAPTTPPTPQNQGAVNGESTKNTTKAATANKDGDKKNTNTTKSDRTVWPWVILILLGAAAVMYGLRGRKETPTPNKDVVTDAKTKNAGKADQPETKPTKTTEKAAVVVPAATPQKATPKKSVAKPGQNRKKSGKKSGKKSR